MLTFRVKCRNDKLTRDVAGVFVVFVLSYQFLMQLFPHPVLEILCNFLCRSKDSQLKLLMGNKYLI